MLPSLEMLAANIYASTECRGNFKKGENSAESERYLFEGLWEVKLLNNAVRVLNSPSMFFNLHEVLVRDDEVILCILQLRKQL